MNFGTKNWNRPTPKKWRSIGDAILILGAGLGGLITALPLSDDLKLWLLPIITFLTPVGKFITKLFGYENNP
jgi:hypothetical protein